MFHIGHDSFSNIQNIQNNFMSSCYDVIKSQAQMYHQNVATIQSLQYNGIPKV